MRVYRSAMGVSRTTYAIAANAISAALSTTAAIESTSVSARCSQARRYVDEDGGDAERATDMIRERTHAERLRGVVPRVDHYDSHLVGIDCGPVWPFANDQRVDAMLGSFTQRVCGGARTRADRPAPRCPRRIARRASHGAAPSVCDCARARDELTRCDVGVAAHADVDGLVAREAGGRSETQLASEQHVVTDLRMGVERQMRRVQPHSRCEQRVDASIVRAAQRLRPSPEEAVMHEEQIRACVERAPNRSLSHIDRGGNLYDLRLRFHLYAVDRLGIVRNTGRVEQRVELGPDARQCDHARHSRAEFSLVDNCGEHM